MIYKLTAHAMLPLPLGASRHWHRMRSSRSTVLASWIKQDQPLMKPNSIAILIGVMMMLSCGCGKTQDPDPQQNASATQPIQDAPSTSIMPTPKEAVNEHAEEDSLARIEFNRSKVTQAFSVAFGKVDKEFEEKYWGFASSYQGIPITHQVGWADDSLQVKVTFGLNCCSSRGVEATRRADSLFLSLFDLNHWLCKCINVTQLTWRGHARKYSGVKHVLFENAQQPTGWEELSWAQGKGEDEDEPMK